MLSIAHEFIFHHTKWYHSHFVASYFVKSISHSASRTTVPVKVSHPFVHASNETVISCVSHAVHSELWTDVQLQLHLAYNVVSESDTSFVDISVPSWKFSVVYHHSNVEFPSVLVGSSKATAQSSYHLTPLWSAIGVSEFVSKWITLVEVSWKQRTEYQLDFSQAWLTSSYSPRSSERASPSEKPDEVDDQ